MDERIFNALVERASNSAMSDVAQGKLGNAVMEVFSGICYHFGYLISFTLLLSVGIGILLQIMSKYTRYTGRQYFVTFLVVIPLILVIVGVSLSALGISGALQYIQIPDYTPTHFSIDGMEHTNIIARLFYKMVMKDGQSKHIMEVIHSMTIFVPVGMLLSFALGLALLLISKRSQAIRSYAITGCMVLIPLTLFFVFYLSVFTINTFFI